MSDQDFFFDEEDEGPKKPAKSDSGASKGAPRDKPASPRPPSAKTPSRTSAPEAAYPTPFFERDTSMAVASLLAVIGLLLGVIGGYLLAGALSNPVASVPAATTGTSIQGGAPGALTPQQLNSGQLPAGHPQIPSGGSKAATPTK